jgi:glycine dehydrogenase subunit 1
MAYTPNPKKVTDEMLHSIGLNSMQELFGDIPDDIKLNRPLNLEHGCSEIELRRHMLELAAETLMLNNIPAFRSRCYDHYVPAVVDQILQRSEFYTAYTPLSAEISQGILQAIILNTRP